MLQEYETADMKNTASGDTEKLDLDNEFTKESTAENKEVLDLDNEFTKEFEAGDAELVSESTEKAESDETKQQKKAVLRFVMKLALVVLIVCAIFTFVFGIRQVSGETMYPSIRDGDLTLYYRLEADYQVGDVVTFKIDGVKCWARIVAQGGDQVEIDDFGHLLVNGNVQQEEVFYSTEPQEGDVTYPYIVPEDSYYVLCDYRTAGVDSRTFGAVSQDDLDGKVITILRRRGI